MRFILVLVLTLWAWSTPVAAQVVAELPIDVAVGKTELPAVTPLKGEDRIIFALDRTDWTDPSINVTALFYISTDGGKTFDTKPFCGVTSRGGKVFSESGKEQTLTSVDCPLVAPEKEVTERQYKTELTVVGGTLKTKIDASTYKKPADVIIVP